MKETCTKVTSSHRGYKLLPVFPLTTNNKVPVTVQVIWLHKPILVLKCWMKERKNAVSQKDAFKFPWLFMNFSKTWSQFPRLFQAWKKIMVFHDFSRISMSWYTLQVITILFTSTFALVTIFHTSHGNKRRIPYWWLSHSLTIVRLCDNLHTWSLVCKPTFSLNSGIKQQPI